MTSLLAAAPDTAANPLEQLPIEALRARTSMKWRAYPADVLPLWVAEMDVPLAPPVAAALHAAIDAGDTGYPAGPGYALAVRDYAAAHWDWPGLDIDRTAIVPDVMMGIAETLKLVTAPGDPVVLRDGQPWLESLLAGLAANRDLLGDLLAEHLPQVRYRPPEATYLAWLDCRALGLHDPGTDTGNHIVSDLAGPARMFLDRGRVALSSGHVFGRGGAGFVRLNFATSPAILRQAIQRMGDAARAQD